MQRGVRTVHLVVCSPMQIVSHIMKLFFTVRSIATAFVSVVAIPQPFIYYKLMRSHRRFETQSDSNHRYHSASSPLHMQPARMLYQDLVRLTRAKMAPVTDVEASSVSAPATPPQAKVEEHRDASDVKVDRPCKRINKKTRFSESTPKKLKKHSDDSMGSLDDDAREILKACGLDVDGAEPPAAAPLSSDPSADVPAAERVAAEAVAESAAEPVAKSNPPTPEDTDEDTKFGQHLRALIDQAASHLETHASPCPI